MATQHPLRSHDDALIILRPDLRPNRDTALPRSLRCAFRLRRAVDKLLRREMRARHRDPDPRTQAGREADALECHLFNRALELQHQTRDNVCRSVGEEQNELISAVTLCAAVAVRC